MRRGFRAGGGGRWPYGRCLGALPEADAPREAQARDRREQYAEPHSCFVLGRGGGVAAMQSTQDRVGGVAATQ